MYKKPKGRHCKSLSINDVVEAFFKDKKMTTRYYETMVIAYWGKIVGRAIEKYTQMVDVKNGVLYVKISSPALVNELSMNRSQLIKLVNTEVEKKVVHKVIFLAGD